MKWLIIIGAAINLYGCAAGPRCEGHLVPINGVPNWSIGATARVAPAVSGRADTRRTRPAGRP